MIFMKRSNSSRGQILLIVAFAMLALIAIGAIVVDLGLSWMLRRQEQNAADPASIAASRYIEEGDSAATRDKMHTAACFYAKENGFFAGDNDTCDTARGDGWLQVHWPPISGPFAANNGMVQVVISAEHASFFGQFLGRPTATVTTGAVAARESTSANTNSLVALDPISCASGKVHGNGTVTIEPVENPDTGEPFNGGYVHLNSECSPSGVYDDDCGSGSGAFHQGGNADSAIIAPHMYIHGTCQESGGEVVSPVTEGSDRTPDPMAGLYGPDQQTYPAGYCPKKQGSQIVYEQSVPTRDGCQWSQNGSTITLVPGVYYGGWKFSGKDVTVRLQPGIYIIAGGGLSITGPDLDSTPGTVGGDPDPMLDPARILIFSTDNTTDSTCEETIGRCVQGDIKISGKSSLRLWGLDSGPWRGMLMWQDGRGSNPTAKIEITGQGELDIAGTIYAPKSHVKIEGNGLSTAILAVQIISWTWDIGGSADLYMPYDPRDLYHITHQGLVD
jgi:hypothetical protein